VGVSKAYSMFLTCKEFGDILNISQIYPIPRLDDITRFLTC
jgi:hypothetical protein